MNIDVTLQMSNLVHIKMLCGVVRLLVFEIGLTIGGCVSGYHLWIDNQPNY